MGGVCGGGDSKTRRINRELKEVEGKEQKKLKILLLGAGESGKTTLFKQMKLLFGVAKQFTASEKDSFRKIISKNILEDILRMLEGVERKNLKLESKEAQVAANRIIKGNEFDPRTPPKITKELAALYSAIWNDQGVQQVWNSRGDVQVQDALKYFMSSIQRISADGWEPTNQDILRARARTTGVQTSKFMIQKSFFEMYDVGGQRTERRKWLFYFDGVTTVLFVAAISEYNQVLFEDPTINRQTEAVELFSKQLQSQAFQTTPFILFLNKKDLFREKLIEVPFRVEEGPNARNVSFPGPHIDPKREYKCDVEGADPEFEKCYDAALRYLTDIYVSQSPDIRREGSGIHVHITNSTDTENIKRIMQSCKDIILQEHINNGGWGSY